MEEVSSTVTNKEVWSIRLTFTNKNCHFDSFDKKKCDFIESTLGINLFALKKHNFLSDDNKGRQT